MKIERKTPTGRMPAKPISDAPVQANFVHGPVSRATMGFYTGALVVTITREEFEIFRDWFDEKSEHDSKR